MPRSGRCRSTSTCARRGPRVVIHVNGTLVEEDTGKGGDECDGRRDSEERENSRANPGQENDEERDEQEDESAEQG